ncbi:hypothetical protein VB620_11630 [Nodularia harveyana UHCC-0300]|uniref:Transposase n=1 Tax=Nodularia harveyana UHCC-0300 TaxID=2974287 RepID=A0ABU5UEQ2_9CYAN|nr:hypothetical protein [Nodularia harveyana UHCC-0300]
MTIFTLSMPKGWVFQALAKVLLSFGYTFSKLMVSHPAANI